MAELLAQLEPAKRARSLRTLIAISIAHWVSHYYLLVLPMLFPFLKERLGVGFIELGLAPTVASVVSALTQAPIGYLVDRVGARIILMLGLCLGGSAFILLSIHLSYPTLIVSALLIGLGNSVYHPMGRAFSIHAFAGFLGSAVAPVIVVSLVAWSSGRGALIASGIIGPLTALLILAVGVPDARAAARNAAEPAKARTNILTPAILTLSVFFMLLGLSGIGISTFGVVALINGYGSSFSAANIALTAYLGATAIGVLAGGLLADRTARHGQLAAVCFAINAVIVLMIATTTLETAWLTAAMAMAGFLSGVIVPSRDMMVRNAAPAGAAGRAFGITSTGFNVGGIIEPLLFGWIMDQQMPHWVFGASAIFMAVTVLLALLPEARMRRAADKTATGTMPS